VNGLRLRVREIGAYGICMFLAVGLDFGLLTLQVSQLGIHYLVATITAFGIANAALYVALSHWVFHQHQAVRRRMDLPCFIALSAAILGLQAVLMWVAVQALHVHYMVAKTSAAGVTFMLSYFARRRMMSSARQVA
jgi:putative flippase GtrA